MPVNYIRRNMSITHRLNFNLTIKRSHPNKLSWPQQRTWMRFLARCNTAASSWVGIVMYKIIIFSKFVFHHTKMIFLSNFEPSFRTSHRKFFLAIFTCQKWLFWLKFLENRPFNSQRILPHLRNLFQTILRAFLHRSVKTDRVALCC